MADIFIQQVVNALVLSAMYALIAVGFTLYFGVLGVINLSHGDVAMVAAFVGLALTGLFTVASPSGWGAAVVLVLVVLGTCLACAVLGTIVERIAFKPLRQTAPIAALLSSVGVAIFLREAVLHWFPNGANPQRFPALLPTIAVKVGGAIIEARQIGIVLCAVLLVSGLYLLVSRTRFGRAIRAVAINRDVAQLLGVNIDVVARQTFMVGSVLAGVAGLMNGLYYNSVMFDMGFLLSVKGFTAAVIGGLRNTWGALVGALLIGCLEAFSAGFIPGGSSYKDTIVFSALVAALIFRPSGLFAEAQGEKA